MTTPHVPYGAPPDDYEGPRRALVLAGGGLRLSYQAGAIRALLEHGLCFTHLDGTSGGSINLAQLLSGLSPQEICRRWSTLNSWDTVGLMPLGRMLRGAATVAVGGAGAMRSKVFPHLGIDFDKIRAATGVEATFNVLDYQRKSVEVIPHTEIDEDLMVAGMSLPGVFPPVAKGGKLYLDTAFVQDANLMEAVRRGADEIWVIWGLGNTASYRGGPLRLYIQMLEMSANGALNVEFERIKEINATRAEPIRVHVIRPAQPLPLDPALYTGAIDHATLIDMGYADTKAYLAAGLDAPPAPGPESLMTSESGPNVTFRETLSGPFTWDDAASGELRLDTAVLVQDVRRCLSDPDYSSCASGRVSISGWEADLPAAEVVYRTSGYEAAFAFEGNPYHLVADRLEFGRLAVRIHKGPGSGGPTIGTGTLELSRPDAIRLLWSTRTSGGGGTLAKTRAYAAFLRHVIRGLLRSASSAPRRTPSQATRRDAT